MLHYQPTGLDYRRKLDTTDVRDNMRHALARLDGVRACNMYDGVPMTRIVPPVVHCGPATQPRHNDVLRGRMTSHRCFSSIFHHIAYCDIVPDLVCYQ